MKKSDLECIPNYFDRYIALADDHVHLIDGLKKDEAIFENISQKLVQYETYRYEPHKWTPKELLQHIIDTERIFAYRALSISRLEPKTLLGFDENVYAKNSGANERTMTSLLKEFQIVRQSTIALFESFSQNMLHSTGVSSEIKISTLAIGFTIIGHARHHLNVLNERYFGEQ